MTRRAWLVLTLTVALLGAGALAATGGWPGRSPSGTGGALITRGTDVTVAPTPAAAPGVAPPAGPDIGPARPAIPGRSLRLGYARPPSTPATIADAAVPSVGLYSAPGDAEPAESMDNPTWEGLAVVFLVQQRFGDWLEVQLSMRPNESTAWVRAADVTLRETTHRITVDLDAHRLVAYDGATVVMDTRVAVGTGSTPTPAGNYFVDGTVKVPDPNGPYGAYQLSVAAFSNVHQTFGGGVGQIAIHGTNNPALIGTPASNGCVRMTNDDVTRLATMVPVGTPVQIVA